MLSLQNINNSTEEQNRITTDVWQNQTHNWARRPKNCPVNKYLFKVNTFQATSLFRYPLKTSENLWFPDVFRGYGKRPVARNRLNRDKTIHVKTTFFISVPFISNYPSGHNLLSNFEGWIIFSEQQYKINCFKNVQLFSINPIKCHVYADSLATNFIKTILIFD